MPVLGQHATQVAELRALLLALAVEPRLGTSGRDVRLAPARLAHHFLEQHPRRSLPLA